MKIPLLKEITAPIRVLDEIIHAEIQNQGNKLENLTGKDVYEQAVESYEKGIKWMCRSPATMIIIPFAENFIQVFDKQTSLYKIQDNSDTINLEVIHNKVLDKIVRVFQLGWLNYITLDKSGQLINSFYEGNDSKIVTNLIVATVAVPYFIGIYHASKALYLRDTDTKPRLKDRINSEITKLSYKTQPNTLS